MSVAGEQKPHLNGSKKLGTHGLARGIARQFSLLCQNKSVMLAATLAPIAPVWVEKSVENWPATYRKIAIGQST
jgi:hypothetical protein